MTTRSLVFIDSRVADYQSLISGLDADTQWVLLDANQDGVLQMQKALSLYSDLDSIHVISHGSQGTLYLGSTVLSNDNLSGYEQQLAQICSSLTDTGDLLLYGCNVGAGETGRQFIESLALATGADVAASTDATGNASQGGNCILEKHTGTLETSTLATVQDYEYALLSIIGTSSSEPLNGTSGNDTLDGRGGSDTIDGGAGTDTAIFFSNRANFTVTTLNGVTRVYSSYNAGAYTYGEVFLTNVEYLQFADTTIPIQPTTNHIISGASYLSEMLNGTSGNDTLDGRGGSDTIDGGAGTDTAIFFSNRANFTVTTLNGVTRVYSS